LISASDAFNIIPAIEVAFQGYGIFLQDVLDALDADSLLQALKWAVKSLGEGRAQEFWSRQLLARSVAFVEDVEIRQLSMQLLFSLRKRDHYTSTGFSDALKTLKSSLRRLLIQDIVNESFHGSWPYWLVVDLVVEMLQEEDDEWISSLLDTHPQTETKRRLGKRLQSLAMTPPTSKTQNSPLIDTAGISVEEEEKVQQALHQLEAGDPMGWHKLFYASMTEQQRLSNSVDLSEMPGWKRQEIRAALTCHAPSFFLKLDPAAGDRLLGSNTYHHHLIDGLHALDILGTEEPERLQRLPSEVFALWIPDLLGTISDWFQDSPGFQRARVIIAEKLPELFLSELQLSLIHI